MGLISPPTMSQRLVALQCKPPGPGVVLKNTGGCCLGLSFRSCLRWLGCLLGGLGLGCLLGGLGLGCLLGGLGFGDLGLGHLGLGHLLGAGGFGRHGAEQKVSREDRTERRAVTGRESP